MRSSADLGLNSVLPLPGCVCLANLLSDTQFAQLSNGDRIAVRATSQGLPGLT